MGAPDHPRAGSAEGAAPERSGAQTARRLLTNLGFLFTGETFARIFTLVAFMYLARVLGPSAFGYVEFAIASVFVAFLVIDFGLGILGARELAVRPERTADMSRAVVWARIWLTGAALAGVGVFAWLADVAPEARHLLIWFGASLIPAPWLLQWVMQGHNRMRDVGISQVVRYGVFAAVVLATVHGAEDAVRVAYAEGLGMLACAAFTAVACRRHFGPFRLRPLSLPDAALLREALPIGGSQFMWAAKFFLPTVLLGLVAAPETVGFFGAATRIAVALHTFIALYFYNLLPWVSQAATRPIQELQALVGQSVRATSWAVVLACCIGTVIAGPLVVLLYGDAYAESEIVLQLLGWMLGAALLSANYRVTLIACGLQGYELLTNAWGGAVNLALIALLYPRFGLAGAAAAMLAAETVTLVAAWLYVRTRVAPVRVGRHVWKPAAAGAVMLPAAGIAAPFGLVPQLLALAVIFALALRLLDPDLVAQTRALLGARGSGAPASADAG